MMSLWVQVNLVIVCVQYEIDNYKDMLKLLSNIRFNENKTDTVM
jgi:hypothetical protein